MLKNLVFFFAIVTTVSSNAFADRKVDTLKNELKEYKQLLSKIRRNAGRLNSTQLTLLKANLPLGLRDSDNDGVPDIVEVAVDRTDSCDDDSYGGGTEVELKGFISAISENTFTVGGKTFTLSDATTFEDGSAAGIVVGACVEVKGTTTNSNSISALRVEFDDSCT